MSTKHTPGPWAYDNATGEVYRDDGDVCPMIANVYRDNTSDTQADADGRLIAAAPELLKALVRANAVLRNLDQPDMTPGEIQDAMKQASAAIAKTKA